MKGSKRFSAAVFAASLIMLLGGGIVSNVSADDETGQRQIEQRHGKYEKFGKDHEFDRHDRGQALHIFKGLNLTQDQKDQMKNLMKGHRKEFMENRIAVLQARQNLMAATTGGAFDQSAVQKASGDMAAAQEKMNILHAKVFSEVMSILTPDQQTVVQGRLAKAKLSTQKNIATLQSKMDVPVR